MRYSKGITEAKVQAKIIAQLTKEGWLCVKLIKTNKNGIPDLMCLRNGVTMFVEVKKENGVLSKLQEHRIDEIRKKGFEVKVWDGYDSDFQK